MKRAWLKQVFGPAPSPVATMAEHTGGVNSVAAFADGRIASGSADNTVKLWDPENNQVTTIHRDYGRPLDIRVSAEGRIAVALSTEAILVFRPDGTLLTAASASGQVNCLAWMPDGQRLVAGTARGLVVYELRGVDEPQPVGADE